MNLKYAKINAKAALVKEQIEDRINKGANTLEIQLLDETQTDKEIDMSLINNIDVCAIHMPLINGKDYDVETVEGREIFKKVCTLASKIANIKNHNIIIVVHTSTPLFKLKEFGIENVLVTTIQEMIDKYSNIEIAIENTTLYDFIPKKGVLCRQNPCYIENGRIKLSNVELAKAVGRDRCGVCFDTCHALMTEAHLRRDNKLFEEYIYNVCNGKRIFTALFEESAPMLKLIHLAYSENHGYNEYHGMPFTGQEFIVLNYINGLYEKYNIDCPVTIEVYEKNLFDAKNYVLTREEIEKL